VPAGGKNALLAFRCPLSAQRMPEVASTEKFLGADQKVSGSS